jgi:sialic acid synthase SpsE
MPEAPAQPHFTLPNGRRIGGDAPVFIVAEVGINHNGSAEQAQALIDSIADAQADAVKLQILNPDANYAPDHPSYQAFQKIDLGEAIYRKLQARAAERGLIFFATPDTPSLRWVKEWGMPLIKISSGMLTDRPHLEAAAPLKVPLIFSSGMSYLDEVARTIRWARELGVSDLAVLHCTSLYPAPPHTLNLKALTLLQSFGVVVGYSDHSEGHTAAVAAVALGAKILEKHVTLDRTSSGPEHHFAADPQQFAEYVWHVRLTEQMLGSAHKEPVEKEITHRALFRRCVVAKQDILPGQVLSRDNVAILRPSPGRRGLEPEFLKYILGLHAVEPIPRGCGIELHMLSSVGMMPSPA